MPTQVETKHFGNSKIFFATAGAFHSASVTQESALYTWGRGILADDEDEKDTPPGGLGHGDRVTKLVPTLVDPPVLQSASVGCCHSLPPLHAPAFTMGTHARLGSAALMALPAQDDCQVGSQRQQGNVLSAADHSKDCE